MITRFWTVWNPDRGAPNKKHKTFEAARRESERLAHKHPGLCYYVMECRGAAQTTVAPVMFQDSTKMCPGCEDKIIPDHEDQCKLCQGGVV